MYLSDRTRGYPKRRTWFTRVSRRVLTTVRIGIRPRSRVVAQCTCLLTFTAMLAYMARFPSRKTERNAADMTSGGVNNFCDNVVISKLTSFDQTAVAKKRRGNVQNNFETRFQEDVWDTLVGRALFPAWSDMKWNIPQYGRGLAEDLNKLQLLTASVVQRGYTADIDNSIDNKSPQNDIPITYGATNAKTKVSYVHHRLDRLRGLQFATSFTIGTAETGKDEEVGMESYIMSMTQSLAGKCEIAISAVVHSEHVYMLVPYQKRKGRLKLFLQNYFELRMVHNEQISLIISVLEGSHEDIEAIKRIRQEIFGVYEATSNIYIHKNRGDSNGKFSRGVALREAAKLAPSRNSILFHCDVDMMILPTFLQRCRHNTILGHQAYYPTFYSLYPYAMKNPRIIQRNGFWRFTSFGMVCIRRGDFDDVNPYHDAETRFQGWGSEDVYMFEKLRNTSNLVAFRAVDPALMHRWHAKECNVSSAAYYDCMKTNFVTAGHMIRIGPVILDAFPSVNKLYERLGNA